jgi:hypothetical protein
LESASRRRVHDGDVIICSIADTGFGLDHCTLLAIQLSNTAFLPSPLKPLSKYTKKPANQNQDQIYLQRQDEPGNEKKKVK